MNPFQGPAQKPSDSRARGPDRTAWNHKAVVSPRMGRGKCAPHPYAEDEWFLGGSAHPDRCFWRVPFRPPGLNKTCTEPRIPAWIGRRGGDGIRKSTGRGLSFHGRNPQGLLKERLCLILWKDHRLVVLRSAALSLRPCDSQAVILFQSPVQKQSGLQQDLYRAPYQ